MRRVVAGGKLLVACSFGLHLVKGLLADHGWNLGDGNPLLWIGKSMTTPPAANRGQRRMPLLSRSGATSTDVDRSQVDRIGKDARNRGLIPAQTTTGSGNLKSHQVLRQPDQTLTIRAAYVANSSATMAASAGSRRTPAGSRGRAGSTRYP